MALTTKRKLPRFVLVLVTTCCSLLIAACAGPVAKGGAEPCNNGDVCAVVKVWVCWAGIVSVDPDPISVTAPGDIEWTVSTDGYTLPDDGIVINDSNASGFKPHPGRVPDRKKFRLHDDHSQKGQFKYTLRVVDSDGHKCFRYDPYINNQ